MRFHKFVDGRERETCIKDVVNPFQHSVAFHIKTSHLTGSANKMIGFYMKCFTGLKWVKEDSISIVKFIVPFFSKC